MPAYCTSNNSLRGIKERKKLGKTLFFESGGSCFFENFFTASHTENLQKEAKFVFLVKISATWQKKLTILFVSLVAFKVNICIIVGVIINYPPVFWLTWFYLPTPKGSVLFIMLCLCRRSVEKALPRISFFGSTARTTTRCVPFLLPTERTLSETTRRRRPPYIMALVVSVSDSLYLYKNSLCHLCKKPCPNHVLMLFHFSWDLVSWRGFLQWWKGSLYERGQQRQRGRCT